ISSATSATGRLQFSVEKPKMVSQRMLRSGAACTMRFTASTPAWCPTVRGRPRRFAHRPLPSMTIATCRCAWSFTPWPGAPVDGLFCWAAMELRRILLGRLAAWRSDVHDLLFFGFQGFVHAPDRLIGQLLDLAFEPLFLVLADHVRLLGG